MLRCIARASHVVVLWRHVREREREREIDVARKMTTDGAQAR